MNGGKFTVEEKFHLKLRIRTNDKTKYQKYQTGDEVFSPCKNKWGVIEYLRDDNYEKIQRCSDPTYFYYCVKGIGSYVSQNSLFSHREYSEQNADFISENGKKELVIKIKIKNF